VHEPGASTEESTSVDKGLRDVAPASSEASDDALIGLNRLATVARLLSGAAHEVNNALQVISGTVEILENRKDAPPGVHDALARLRHQSNRAASALAQVLLFTRAPREGVTPVNLRELAQESLALREFSIRRARLTARIDADESTPFVVTGNRGDLQQALLNVVMNAEQALNGTPGAIVVQLSLDDAFVVLRVIDEGPGVTLDPPDRAFQAFVTTREPFESAGLGLWAARTLVEVHGGTLTIENRSAGAAVAMRLPRAAPRQAVRRTEL
jgi:signal transduction histidine kinase